MTNIRRPLNKLQAERNQDIVSKYLSGKYRSMRILGNEYGISRERVRQLLVRSGVYTRDAFTKHRWRRVSSMNAVQASEETGLALATMRKWGLPMPRTAAIGGHVKHGQDMETKISDLLKERGHTTELMPNHHPFDILVDGKTRVDVKSKQFPVHNHSGYKNLWIFCIRKRNHAERTDFFVCHMIENGDYLIIPAKMTGSISCLGFTHPKDRSFNKPNKWDKYLNAWHLIETIAHFA